VVKRAERLGKTDLERPGILGADRPHQHRQPVAQARTGLPSDGRRDGRRSRRLRRAASASVRKVLVRSRASAA
jgi:hypothetical protein